MPGGMTGQVEITPWQEWCRCLRMSSLYLGATAQSAPAGTWSRVTPPRRWSRAGRWHRCLRLLCIRPGSWEISPLKAFANNLSRNDAARAAVPCSGGVSGCQHTQLSSPFLWGRGEAVAGGSRPLLLKPLSREPPASGGYSREGYT